MGPLSRKDSLALKKRDLGCTVIDLVMKIKPFKGVNTKAWHFLLKKEQQFSFFMFNCITSDKSVTYKTEILCTCWSSGRAGRKNTWLGIMTYGPNAARSFLHDSEPDIFRTGPTKFGQWAFYHMTTNWWKFQPKKDAIDGEGNNLNTRDLDT